MEEIISTILMQILLDPLPALGIVAVVVVGIIVYALSTSAKRAQARLTPLIHELDTVSKKLAEAEKIGNFGSFSWDFIEPSVSFWSQEMYRLAGLVARKKPPTIEAFIATAHEKDREAVEKNWDKAQKHAGEFSFVFRAVDPSGQIRYLRVQGVTTMTPKKQLQSIQGVAHDITKEMEVDQAKTEFVSLASHQLKTPLTTIKWLSEALVSGAVGVFSDEQKDYIQKIEKENSRMMEMVNDLLSVSRIELGTFSTHREDIDVRGLAESVIEEQKHSAEGKNLSLVFTCAEGIRPIHGDKTLLRMIFQNLISNAIKYTPANGKVECEVSASGVKQEGILIRVADTGIGIPKSEQGRVFEKLHRATNAQAQVPDGTGLGLYVIKIIVDHVGGAISFDSIEGKGSTFYVSVPYMWKGEESVHNAPQK